jgi:hypothetical protein
MRFREVCRLDRVLAELKKRESIMNKTAFYRFRPECVIPLVIVLATLAARPLTAAAQQPLTFEGTVYEQTGDDVSTKRPLANATIQIRRQGDTAGAVPVEVRTDDQGRVQLTIPGGPGDYQAIASMANYRPQTIGLMVRDAGEHHAAEFILKTSQPPAPKMATLNVQVMDGSSSSPIPGAMVLILRNGGQYGHGQQTGADGNVSRSLPRATYEVVVKNQGYQPHHEKVALLHGDENLNVVLIKNDPDASLEKQENRPNAPLDLKPVLPINPNQSGGQYLSGDRQYLSGDRKTNTTNDQIQSNNQAATRQPISSKAPIKVIPGPRPAISSTVPIKQTPPPSVPPSNTPNKQTVQPRLQPVIPRNIPSIPQNQSKKQDTPLS